MLGSNLTNSSEIDSSQTPDHDPQKDWSNLSAPNRRTFLTLASLGVLGTAAVATCNEAANNTVNVDSYFYNPEGSLRTDAFTKYVQSLTLSMQFIFLAAEQMPIDKLFKGKLRNYCEEYQNIDCSHKIANCDFRNLGILHCDPYMQKHKDSLHSSIVESDIVCLEAPTFEPWNSPQRELSKTAQGLNKHVIQNDTQLATLLTHTVSTTFLSMQAARLYKKQATANWAGLATNDSFLTSSIKTLGWLSALIAYPSIPSSISQITERGVALNGYGKNDLSLVVDWRTVKMLQNIFIIAEKYPGKRILLICGDEHARGIEYYLQNTDKFNFKSALYKNTYDKLYRNTLYDLANQTPSRA